MLMVQHVYKKYESISQYQIDELTNIYDEYLYMARQQELLLQGCDIKYFACDQLSKMYPDELEIPWKVDILNRYEKKQFDDFINNDVSHDNTRTYVLLEHIKPEENVGYSKDYTIPPYTKIPIIMQLPSLLERCQIIYPTDGTLGNTEFYVDGIYKARYTNAKNKNKLLRDYIRDSDMIAELCLLVQLFETLHKNIPNIEDENLAQKKAEKLAMHVYAEEYLSINENTILELISSFADKILTICRKIYNTSDTRSALEQAQSEGLILSSDNIHEYINIRHFLRHQIDTLDELGCFSKTKSNENKIARNNYINSYLKFCDKSIIQRMKSYIDVLHQMQHVVNQINPNRIIRNKDESNNKFIDRVKAAYQIKPDALIELNYPLFNKKYNSLNKNLHKILPEIKIVDEYSENSPMKSRVDDYGIRSYFLQTFQSLECMVMDHCKKRGHGDKENREAWEYLKDIGVLTPQEFVIWHHWGDLRNLLCHNYFNSKLRAYLYAHEETYNKDLYNLANKLIKIEPQIRKVNENIREYIHADGTVVRLDIKHHVVLDDKKFVNAHAIKTSEKTDVEKESKQQKIRTEICPNGMVFRVSDKKIMDVKLPNGITVNFKNYSIDWDNNTHWYKNAKGLNVLQSGQSKLLIDHSLRVMEYCDKNSALPISSYDDWLFNNRHNFVVNFTCRITEFRFKTNTGNIIKTAFMRTKQGYNVLIFSDGTIVLLTGKEIIIRHNGIILNFDNRNEFTNTYNSPKNIVQQNIRNNHYR